MIQVSVMYPNQDDARFDMAYYTEIHIPLVRKLTGDACRRVSVQRGLGGPQPHSKPTYVALGHLYFDSVPAFEQAFGPHAQQIMADLSNFTNLNPTIQINEVVVE
ncbi:MAG: EthD family reductase [Alphaproteobacteria bacterium]|nr:EthD family reductase [Alphaproteobacteria bacterium]